jgi:hypothetical protein
MNDDDDIDAWPAGKPFTAPPDFAARITALARVSPQLQERSWTFRPWQWASLGAVAGLGALQLCGFVFVAFVAAGAN